MFVGNGPAGWDRVTKEGKLGAKSVALLDASYVRLYVDARTEMGKELATGTFRVPDGLGLVIIDPQVGHILFRQTGASPDADLQSQLAKLTEPKATVRTVNYRSATTPASPAKQPQAAAAAKPAPPLPKKNC